MKKNKLKQIKIIYNYILDNLNYRNTDFQGAKFAYQTMGRMRGICCLFVALLRSMECLQGGFWILGDPRYGQTHVWAEFYIQDIGGSA